MPHYVKSHKYKSDIFFTASSILFYYCPFLQSIDRWQLNSCYLKKYKVQSPLCAGWQYVSFRILNHAGWLTSVVHDGWLGVLFPETLVCWQWRAGNFFPGELNINEDWRRSTLLVVTTLYEQISQKWSLGTPIFFAHSRDSAMSYLLCTTNKLSINLTKTNYMIISSSRKGGQIHIHKIERKSQIKYLGVFIKIYIGDPKSSISTINWWKM